MELSALTDEKLITLLQDNRQAEVAFNEIYDRYWRKLTSLAIFKTNSKEIANEIVQEIFIKLWEKRNKTSISHLESYLFTALKYQIISHLRIVIANRKLLESQEIEPQIHSQESITAEVVQSTIEKTISQLPDRTQQIFRLSRFEEKTHKEISSELDISEKSVEYHITQSLKLLRERLKDFLVLALILS